MPKCLIVVTIATALCASASQAVAQSSRANGHAMRSNPSSAGLLISVPALAALERPAAGIASAHSSQFATPTAAPMTLSLDMATAGRAGGAPGLAGTALGLDGVNPGKGHEKASGAVQRAQSVEAQQQSSRMIPTCQ